MRKMMITNEGVREYIRHLRIGEKSENTVVKYQRDVMKLVDFSGGGEIEKADVIRFKEYLVERYQPTSVNSIIAAINGYFDFEGWYELKVKQLKIQHSPFCSPDKELTKTDYYKLIKTAEKQGRKRLALILKTVCSTGMRISELEYVTVESLVTGEIEVCCKGKRRTVFILPGMLEMLKNYADESGIRSGSVFVTSSGKHIDRSNIWKELKSLCKKADVPSQKVFPHNLRHLFARCYYEIDKDIVKLADILGHSNINTTRIYTASSGTEHKKLLEKMELINF